MGRQRRSGRSVRSLAGAASNRARLNSSSTSFGFKRGKFRPRLLHQMRQWPGYMLAGLLQDIAQCQNLRGSQRLRLWHADIRRDTGALPVRPANRVDRPTDWDVRTYMRCNREAADWMRAAAGDLADDRRALQVLEIVGELLSAGKGVVAGQHIHRLAGAIAPPRHVG